MPKNKIDDLRDHLFETLAALRRAENPMELDRAHAIAAVGKVIIESAKVEVNFLKVTGTAQGTGFLPEPTQLSVATGQLRQLPPVAVPPGEACVLCGVRLTTDYNVQRGLCGSCAERPEAKSLPRDTTGRALARTA